MANENLPALPPVDSAPAATESGTMQAQGPNGIDTLIVGPSSKDVMIGAGALVVLTIIFLVIRHSIVNYLTGPSMKRSPNNAGLAGWGFFGGMFFGASLGCMALISASYMTLMMIIPLSILSLVSFIIGFVVASKK